MVPTSQKNSEVIDNSITPQDEATISGRFLCSVTIEVIRAIRTHYFMQALFEGLGVHAHEHTNYLYITIHKAPIYVCRLAMLAPPYVSRKYS